MLVPKTASLISSILLLCAVGLHGQVLTALHSFAGTDGENPGSSLIQGVDGDLYGTTISGGTNGHGTAFKISQSGVFTTLYNFCSLSGCTDGAQPYGKLFQADDGNFYGTTSAGGTFSGGTAFKMTPSGALTTLYTFCSGDFCLDGSQPFGGLVQGDNGDFYGTTDHGGTRAGGTVFEMTPSGGLTTLYSFCVFIGCGGGFQPYGGLARGVNGNFYGTTFEGGSSEACGSGCGTVYEISPSGVYTTLHSFTNTDGSYPESALVQDDSGNFWGTTNNGAGSSRICDSGCGGVFKISPAGALTAYGFDYTNGEYPVAPVLLATNGDFYGTTTLGGESSGNGILFKLTPGGVITPAYQFCSPPSSCPEGYKPTAGLVQATNGDFYGTTCCGGENGDYGTIFRFAAGLSPFLKTRPESGGAGTVVRILGTHLAGASGVSFNGTVAAFTVASDTEIVTDVPTGATSGKVQVTTASGALFSNVAFRVP